MSDPPTAESRDLLGTLDAHREFLRFTLRGLSDDQLWRQSTVSELCLGAIVKHLTSVEAGWCRFVVEGTADFAGGDDAGMAAHARQFQREPGDTADALLSAYDAAATTTDDLLAETDLDASQPLPVALWFPPGARWTARQAMLHILAEKAQHAGHADIIREAIDGQKTMG
jgi:Protein of unknown function (DUF664)